MPRLRVDVDLSKVDKAIKRFARAGGDLRPVWKKTQFQFRKQARDNIKTQSDPGGRKWEPLADRTLRKRLGKLRRRHQASFKKDGTLRKSKANRLAQIFNKQMVKGAKIEKRRTYMAIKTVRHWQSVHQKGGRTRQGNIVPRRTFLYVNDDFLKRTLLPVMRQHLKNAWKGERL